MRIFIIRHGESTSDIENRYGGDYDDHLTEKGIEQANQLAEKLNNCGIEIVYSSPRQRAKETAEILKNNLNCELQIVDDLRERNAYGILTGMVKEEAKAKYPELVNRLVDYKSTIEGAEEYGHLLERAKNAFENIINSSIDTVAILSHGGFIRCIFRDVFKWGELKELGDCAYIELERKDNDYKILSKEKISL